MLPLLFCSIILTHRLSTSLSPAWRAEELHISELLLSILATPSPFPYCLPFLRSLHPSINPPQHSRHMNCPHLNYCSRVSVLHSHTLHLLLLLVSQAACICAQKLHRHPLPPASSFPKALLLLSSCPMYLPPFTSIFSLTCKLSSSFPVYLV